MFPSSLIVSKHDVTTCHFYKLPYIGFYSSYTRKISSLTKTPFSAFKASLGLHHGCGLLLGAFWIGDPTETDVSTLALLSLGETVSMVRLIIAEDGGFSPNPGLFHSNYLGSGHYLH